MASVTVEIPDDLLVKLKNGGGDAGQELRLAAAFSLCSRGELSTSQAARLAGLTYADFAEIDEDIRDNEAD
jgi:predicted HTH domain antitoxin